MCPFAKTIGMMKVIFGFHEVAQRRCLSSSCNPGFSCAVARPLQLPSEGCGTCNHNQLSRHAVVEAAAAEISCALARPLQFARRESMSNKGELIAMAQRKQHHSCESCSSEVSCAAAGRSWGSATSQLLKGAPSPQDTTVSATCLHDLLVASLKVLRII